MSLLEFITVAILAFAITILLAGLFTAYFGSGKSRVAGILMIVTGIITGVMWVFLCNGLFGCLPIIGGVDIWYVFYNALIDLIGILIGALIAVGIFIITILKS